MAPRASLALLLALLAWTQPTEPTILAAALPDARVLSARAPERGPVVLVGGPRPPPTPSSSSSPAPPPRLFDVFPYAGEECMLLWRVALLKDVVDVFVVTEGDRPFVGGPARAGAWAGSPPSLLTDATRRAMLALGARRVAHITVQLDEHPARAWDNEFAQRDGAVRALLGGPGPWGDPLGDDDAVLAADVDEVPDPAVLAAWRSWPEVVKLNMDMRYYTLRCATPHPWNSTAVVRGRLLRALPSLVQHRFLRWELFPLVQRAGWHCSYCMGLRRIREKLKTFSHVEYSGDEYAAPAHISAAVERCEDLLRRPDHALTRIPDSEYAAPPLSRAFERCRAELDDADGGFGAAAAEEEEKSDRRLRVFLDAGKD
jgi:hypothetical protein